MRPAFASRATWERARLLGLSVLTCLGRHTITGLLTTSGQQHVDWSAAYRLFEQKRIDVPKLWAPLRRAAVDLLPPSQPIVGALDDTLLPRTGRKVVGAAWRRDPLGPPFQTNLVWAQRCVQTTVLVPEGPGAARARAIPVDLTHAPTPVRPRKGAPAEAWEAYRAAQQEQKLSAVGLARMQALREALDTAGARDRKLVLGVDGSYTNRTVFREELSRTTLIGRCRGDAALYGPPPTAGGRGRPRVYGARVPTPEQVRQDPRVPWQSVTVYAAGRRHQM